MPAEPIPVRTLSVESARRFVLAAQGLAGGPPPPSVQSVLEHHGLVRTLGGVDAYLALRARAPQIARAEVDAAVEAGRARVSPAARGCIYVVPESAAPLALRIADLLSAARAAREQERAGIRPGELADTARAVRETLARKGPLSTEALRRTLPAGTVRGLSEAGKAVGITSTLPPALRRLELDGEIERRPEGGRLDTERYSWRVTQRNLFAAATLPDDPIELYSRLAARFFRAAGLATIRDWASWCGCSQKEARAALERLPLEAVAIEGTRETYLAPAELGELFEDVPSPAGRVSLLAFEDNVLALHGGPALFADPAHHHQPVPSWGRIEATTLGAATHLSFRALIAEGRLAGFWEYDPERREVVTALLERPNRALARAISDEAAAVLRFVEGELGHARSYSLDTEAGLAERAAALRKLAGKPAK